jgi:hypothetical protein
VHYNKNFVEATGTFYLCYALIAMRRHAFIGYDVLHDSIQCNGRLRRRPDPSGGGMAACPVHFYIMLGRFINWRFVGCPLVFNTHQMEKSSGYRLGDDGGQIFREGCMSGVLGRLVSGCGTLVYGDRAMAPSAGAVVVNCAHDAVCRRRRGRLCIHVQI